MPVSAGKKRVAIPPVPNVGSSVPSSRYRAIAKPLPLNGPLLAPTTTSLPSGWTRTAEAPRLPPPGNGVPATTPPVPNVASRSPVPAPTEAAERTAASPLAAKVRTVQLYEATSGAVNGILVGAPGTHG